MTLWPFTVTVTLRRNTSSGLDGYGNDVLTATDVPVAGCVMWPIDSNAAVTNEYTDARNQVFSGYAVLVPYGTAVSPVDQFILPNGLLYEITGEVMEWQSPQTNRRYGAQVSLKRITG